MIINWASVRARVIFFLPWIDWLISERCLWGFPPRGYSDQIRPNLTESDQFQQIPTKSDHIYQWSKSDRIWPSPTESDRIRPNLTKSDQIWPNLTKSDQIRLSPTKSNQVRPNPTKSDQVRPKIKIQPRSDSVGVEISFSDLLTYLFFSTKLVCNQKKKAQLS